MALAQTDNATLDHPLGDLIVWAKEHGAYIHPLLELRKDPVKGWSFRILPAHMWPPSEKTANSQDQVSIPVNHAVYEIPASTPIVTCPYAVSLSYLNAAGLFGNPSRNLAPDFPASFLKVVGAHAPSVVGNFFLMQQYLLGPRSFWYPYIRNLPQPDQAGRVGTPIFWPEEDLRYLTGTNLEPALKQQDDLWRQQWADAAKFLEVANYHHWEIYTYELYKWAASIFGSRSFRASLTIPLELVSSPDADTGHIYQEHIRADNFSVLLPLLDIGNHNGLNNVEWHEQPEEKCFQLRTRHGIQAGVELYNFYGDKTNSELLMAYGFMLPSPEPIDRDSVNLMVKFSEEHLNLWQGLHCFVPDNSSTQIIGKRIFTVQRIRQRNPELLGDSTPLQQDTRIEELRPFSDGLVDILMIISANEQESQYIAANTSICPERSPNLLAGPLVRVAIQVLSILRFKLEQELYRIQDANTGLGNPQNSNQRLAMDFRNRQISVLQAALDPITFRLRSLLNRTSLWGNGASYTYISQGRENQGLSLVTDSHLEPLSLECAYGWLRTNYPGVSEWIEERIACDQDELLPLNWANIAGENWEYVYFTLWVFILLAIWAREPEFSSNHLMLATWLHEVNQVYIKLTKDNKYEFPGDTDERDTIDTMIQELYHYEGVGLPNNTTWTQEQNIEDEEGTVRVPKPKIIRAMRDFASFVATEEMVKKVKYTMQSGPRQGQETEQSILLVVKGKVNALSEAGGLGHSQEPIWPGWTAVLQSLRRRRSIRDLPDGEADERVRGYMAEYDIDMRLIPSTDNA